MGAQESLDSPNHGMAVAVLLVTPQPILAREVGSGQSETHNDTMQATRLWDPNPLGGVSELRRVWNVCIPDLEMEGILT